MSVLPRRLVTVSRRTELDELLARHGTRGQVEFFLRTRGRTLAELDDAHDAQLDALQSVGASAPADWRRAAVERADLPRFLFGPDDVVVVVGQDGLVANVAKYLGDQPVLGVAPRSPGPLVPFTVAQATRRLLRAERDGLGAGEARVTVQAVTDDGQRLRGLNEIYLGHPSHQSARYRLSAPGGRQEAQSSSGVLVATGTGATGWCASVLGAHDSALEPPAPTEAGLTWLVREAWPSPWTGATLVEGLLDAGSCLVLTSTSDRLVVFGDGIEHDALALGWGQSVTVSVASERLHLLV